MSTPVTTITDGSDNSSEMIMMNMFFRSLTDYVLTKFGCQLTTNNSVFKRLEEAYDQLDISINTIAQVIVSYG